MAPERLNRNINCLHILSNTTKKQRDALINTASKDQIQCICDCANNFLRGNVPFTEDQIRKLKRYQKQIRILSNKNHINIKNKKKILVQHGGFLPILLAPILSVAGTLLADLIKNDAR